LGKEHEGAAITTVTTPALAVMVDPVGSGGVAGFSVNLIFGVPPAPPVYFRVVVHPVR
jgi:hypothetical protein